jgi:hypothetical protein
MQVVTKKIGAIIYHGDTLGFVIGDNNSWSSLNNLILSSEFFICRLYLLRCGFYLNVMQSESKDTTRKYQKIKNQAKSKLPFIETGGVSSSQFECDPPASAQKISEALSSSSPQ